MEKAEEPKKAETLFDAVDEIQTVLLRNPKYIRYAEATDDAGAAEGKLVIDDVLVAVMIRDYAKRHVIKNAVYIDLQDCKLAQIMKLYGQVMRRYGMSRAQRRG